MSQISLPYNNNTDITQDLKISSLVFLEIFFVHQILLNLPDIVVALFNLVCISSAQVIYIFFYAYQSNVM